MKNPLSSPPKPLLALFVAGFLLLAALLGVVMLVPLTHTQPGQPTTPAAVATHDADDVSLRPTSVPSPSYPAPTPKPVPLPTQRMLVTFYAARDNDPPGSHTIAYPGSAPRHARTTTDVGTYDHPITLASDTRYLPAGTRVYVVKLHKYLIMEDECVSAEQRYSRDGTRWIDLYISDSTASGVLAAADTLTGDDTVKHIVVVNPPAGLAVDTTPLYVNGTLAAASHYNYAEVAPAKP
jgi:hypothetical protein